MSLCTEQRDTSYTSLSLHTLLRGRIAEKNCGVGLYIESNTWTPVTALSCDYAEPQWNWGGKVKVTLNDISHIHLCWVLGQPLACSNLSGFKWAFGTPPHLGISKNIAFNFCSLQSLSEHPFICSWHWYALYICATALWLLYVWILTHPLECNVQANIVN